MSRAIIVLILMAVVFFGALSMLPGCASAPEPTDPDLRPIYTAAGEARSLATDSPALAAMPGPDPRDGQRPWYYARKDRGTTLITGYQRPAVLGAYTRTHDHLHTSSRGNVHDHYSQHTYRYEAVEGAR